MTTRKTTSAEATQKAKAVATPRRGSKPKIATLSTSNMDSAYPMPGVQGAATGLRRFGYKLLSQTDIEQLFMEAGVAQRIVTLVAEEMFRAGFDIIADGFDQSEFKSRWETLDATNVCTDAFTWMRMYGGAAIALGTTTEGDTSKPLNPSEELAFLRAVASVELRQDSNNQRMDTNQFGWPEMWEVDPIIGTTRIRIHNSRLLKIKGNPLPAGQRKLSAGGTVFFGASVLQGIADEIVDYEVSHQWASKLLKRLQQMVYKADGAGDACDTRSGRETMLHKLAFVDGQRSAENTVMIDRTTEEIDLLNGSVAGVTDLLKEKKGRLSTSTGIPAIVLAGDTSGGLNNSAEGAMQSWSNFVSRNQELKGTPIVSSIVSIMYPDLKSFKVEWRPLTEESPEQLAERVSKWADAATKLVTAYVISADEARATFEKQGDWLITGPAPVPPEPTLTTAEEDAAANPGGNNAD